MSESDLEANTRNKCKAREYACEQITIGFDLTSNWLRKRCENIKGKQSQHKLFARNNKLKTALKLQINRLTLHLCCFSRLW